MGGNGMALFRSLRSTIGDTAKVKASVRHSTSRIRSHTNARWPGTPSEEGLIEASLGLPVNDSFLV